MQTCAIALFAFNRPDLLQKTLTALSANDLADTASLTIFCDGPRHEKDEPNTRAVRELAKAIKGFYSVEVVERSKNMGCAASVIDGLTEMFRLHEKLIVIEDDIVTSPYTLRFLSEGLARYTNNEKVFNIAAWTPPHIMRQLADGYPFDVYAIPRFNCWGWTSWRDRFQDVDWEVQDYQTFRDSPQLRKAFNTGGEDLSPMLDMQMAGKINSWAIRADYARFKKNMLGINPLNSYTLNIGMGSGTHTTTATTYWDSKITLAPEYPRFMDTVTVDERIQKIYHTCYSKQNRSFPIRAFNKLSRIILGKNLIS